MNIGSWRVPAYHIKQHIISLRAWCRRTLSRALPDCSAKLEDPACQTALGHQMVALAYGQFISCIHLHTCACVCGYNTHVYLSTYLPTYLSIYLPTYLSSLYRCTFYILLWHNKMYQKLWNLSHLRFPVNFQPESAGKFQVGDHPKGVEHPWIDHAQKHLGRSLKRATGRAALKLPPPTMWGPQDS